MRGRFITFEGGEGTGKSTQISLVSDFLEAKGLPVLITREPGGTEGAELIRNLLVTGDVQRWDSKTELLLMVAARRDHFLKKILPALEQGVWVLCDRFHDSTVAYQGYGHGLSQNLIDYLYKNFIEGPFPDRTYILMLSAQQGLLRTQDRHSEEDRFEHMGLSFHEKVQLGYQRIAQDFPDRCRIIDASLQIQDVASSLQEDLARTFFKP